MAIFIKTLGLDAWIRQLGAGIRLIRNGCSPDEKRAEQLTPPHFIYFFNSLFAVATTFATLIPSLSSAMAPGAEAPNRSRPITAPLWPMYLYQPSVAPASSATFGVFSGIRPTLYASSCSS